MPLIKMYVPLDASLVGMIGPTWVEHVRSSKETPSPAVSAGIGKPKGGVAKQRQIAIKY